MIRKVTALGAGICALLLGSPFVSAKTSAPADLGTLGGTTSQATAINCKGKIVGTSGTTDDASQHAFIAYSSEEHRQYKLKDLGTLPGGTNSFGLAISREGKAAGYSETNDPINGIVLHAFLYSEGVLSDLGTLGGTQSQANGVNDHYVVGSSLTADNTTLHAVVWAGGTPTDLGTLGGTNSAALGVNDGHLAVGYAETTQTDQFGFPIYHAVIWDLKTKTATDIGTLPNGVDSQAIAINNYGAVVGISTDALGVTHPFLYFNGKITDLGTLGGSYAQPNAINDEGVVVGSSNTAGDASADAFVWSSRTGLLDLNTLTPATSKFTTLTSASGINDDFQIVGSGTDQGVTRGFELGLFGRESDD